MVINHDELRRGPEAYLGWWLEGAPGSPMQQTSYSCYASEDRGEARFQVTANASALPLDHAAKYEEAAQAAFATARGRIFLGGWNDGREYGINLPPPIANVPTRQLRDALIRGLHWLYESGWDPQQVVVDYHAVAVTLGVSPALVERAAEHLHGMGLVTDEPATHGRNWSTGSIWLTPAGVQYAEGLAPVPSAQGPTAAIRPDEEPPAIWDVFISHASEDKDSVARPLAERLTGRGLAVWLDENELTIGDSLRAKIDHGLANSRHGIVILSKQFFAKDWPQRELDGLSALESARRKVILPVWHEIGRDYIARYSPMLADKFAARTADGLDVVVIEVLKAIGRA